MDAALIALTKVDWQRFDAAAKQLLGRSVSASLDESKIPVRSAATFVCALGEFESANSNPIQVLRTQENLLRHCYASFIVKLPRHQQVTLAFTDLAVVSSVEGAIVSGTILQWFRATLWILSKDRTNDMQKNLRSVLNAIVYQLELADFGEIWSDFSKEQLTDGTFVLVRK